MTRHASVRMTKLLMLGGALLVNGMAGQAGYLGVTEELDITHVFEDMPIRWRQLPDGVGRQIYIEIKKQIVTSYERIRICRPELLDFPPRK